MQRDMQLVRRILMTIESRTDLTNEVLRFGDVDDKIVARHVEMLHHNGLIDGVKFKNHILVRDLSWDGHDFVAALKNETVWSQIKSKFSAAELTTIPLAILKDVGVGYLRQFISEKTGMPL